MPDELYKTTAKLRTSFFNDPKYPHKRKRVADLTHSEIRELSENWMGNRSTAWGVAGAIIWRLLNELEHNDQGTDDA